MGQRPLLCPLHGARCDATPARTCITMSRYEAQYGTGGLIPASTLTLIIPESSSDLYEDLLSLPPSVPSFLLVSALFAFGCLGRLGAFLARWLPAARRHGVAWSTSGAAAQRSSSSSSSS